MMFIDEAVIQVQSGKGGDGMVHFHREKYKPRGGPDGGDGGRGGDIVLEVLPTLNTLYSLRHKKRFNAQDGMSGGVNNMSGRSGEDLVIHIPPGTMVINDSTGDLIGDLVHPGERLIIAKGGRGGRGNARFATAKRQAPRVAERGEPGAALSIRLELKLIADVGIIGAPNAGKSTFLASVTSAKPKIAPYPFTTIEPNLGVSLLDDETNLILADIPGLIEGAHQGIGLGHDFLKHIQRTRVLIHLVDGLSQDPFLDFIQINSELALFDPDLIEKPQIIAVNKMDIPEVRNRWPMIEAQFIKDGKQPYAISAATGEKVRTILYKAAQILRTLSPKETLEAVPIYRLDSDPRDFTIERSPEGWRVHGVAIERAASMTYWEYEESIRRFQRILESLGIDDSLRKEGIKDGDTVFIGDYELEWHD
jgi:GTP-binding protein